MELEIDVSGQDLFSKDYTIVVAEKNGGSKDPIIFGYKFNENIIKALVDRHLRGNYRYGFSQSQRALFKIRVYSIVVYYILEYIQNKKDISKFLSLTICRDFYGHENDIRSNLKYLLTDILKLEITSIHFCKLQRGSNADRYAFLMNKDKKNAMKQNYVDIDINKFEQFLRK